jgi:hypothetical protein
LKEEDIRFGENCNLLPEKATQRMHPLHAISGKRARFRSRQSSGNFEQMEYLQ